VIAVDIGGTELKAAVCDAEGTPLFQRRLPTPTTGAIAVLDAIAELIQRLREDAGGLAIVGAGLIMPGVVDAEAGIIRYSTNIDWDELPIRELIGDRVELPVAIEHDARAAGLAEFRLGAARGVDEALFVSIGTGIGAATITSGRVVAGATGRAGELGHAPAFHDGERCACGQIGCVETYASASALPRRYQALGGTDPRCVRAEQVIARAEAGDEVATAVFDAAIAALAQVLAGYTMIMDPALIVLGGGLSLAGEKLLLPLAERLRLALAWREPPPLALARFGAQAGQVGAALVGWQAYRAQLPSQA
jgi:glucokinase